MMCGEWVLEIQEGKPRDCLVRSWEVVGWQAEADELRGLGREKGEEQTHPSRIRG